MSDATLKFSSVDWINKDPFSALAEISVLLDQDEKIGRDALVRSLEHKHIFNDYEEILGSLIQKAGLYPYLSSNKSLTTGDLLNYEYHSVNGLDGIYLHSAQARVYRALMDGVSVILSAPTSFGKSLLIDAVIASGKYRSIVIVVPTIALIDETRRRLSRQFGASFKIITHPSQQRSDKNIFILTQERYVEFEDKIEPDFFVLDEFYKLSPSRGDDRTFTLNRAFYELFKSGARFFLIGPNVQDIKIDESDLNFIFFRFDFSTVATEIRYSKEGTQEGNALEICQSITESTLLFCKSASSAYKLAKMLIENGVSCPSDRAKELASWLRENYHQDWQLAALLDHGFAVHHGSLPRSVAYHILRIFNEGGIRFLLCTSTIIEGVNTSAKNIVIYDNKIANTKFDQFTFNNIKGRAGRMFKHFVGHIYVLHPEPEPELPIVDVPAITQPKEAPDSLLIHLDHADLSEYSLEQLKYLHAQDYLPVDVIKLNSGVDPSRQIDLAAEIASNLTKYHPLLAWTSIPRNKQLVAVCNLIFDFLMKGRGRDGVFTGKQLHFQISRFSSLKTVSELIKAELQNDRNTSATQAVENTLKFLRQWCEFHFPRYLSSLDRIQNSVFRSNGFEPGDYSKYGSEIKSLFMHPAVTVLEEYGLPYSVTSKIIEKYNLGGNVDDFLLNLPKVDCSSLNLTGLEAEMLADTLKNL